VLCCVCVCGGAAATAATASTVCAVVLPWLSNSRGVPDTVLLLVGYIVFACGALALALSPSTTTVWVSLPFLGFGIAVLRTTPASLASQRAGASVQGGAMGLLDAASSCCRVLAPLAAGLLIDRSAAVAFVSLSSVALVSVSLPLDLSLKCRVRVSAGQVRLWRSFCGRGGAVSTWYHSACIRYEQQRQPQQQPQQQPRQQQQRQQQQQQQQPQQQQPQQQRQQRRRQQQQQQQQPQQEDELRLQAS
jgi:MFS family permease